MKKLTEEDIKFRLIKYAETHAKMAGYAMTVWRLVKPIIDKLPL